MRDPADRTDACSCTGATRDGHACLCLDQCERKACGEGLGRRVERSGDVADRLALDEPNRQRLVLDAVTLDPVVTVGAYLTHALGAVTVNRVGLAYVETLDDQPVV